MRLSLMWCHLMHKVNLVAQLDNEETLWVYHIICTLSDSYLTIKIAIRTTFVINDIVHQGAI